MNEIFQAKVLLTLYKNLQGAIRENEKKVLKCAGRGFYTHGADDTMKLYEKIIEMNSEKIKLLNLKVLIDKALHLMLKEDVRFIVLRFFKGMKFIDIGNVFNVSLRQVFRLYDRATESFKNQLQAEFNSMVESVGKYGGFYVGRYEMSLNASGNA